ncbi:hypothetical protein ACJMK2_033620, partial [Sinanodonta woodiana]
SRLSDKSLNTLVFYPDTKNETSLTSGSCVTPTREMRQRSHLALVLPRHEK